MKMKLSHFLTLIVFGTAVWTAASEDCSSSVSPALSRNKRGITDFFRRLVGGRRKNPTYHHQHQSASPFGHSGSSSNVAGGQDFLYGQSSNQYPMYQAGNVGLSQQASEYVFPGISSSQAGAFSFGNYGSPNGNNAQQGQQPFYYNQAGQQDNSGYVNQGEQQQYQQGGEQQQQHQHQPGQQYHLQQQQHHSGNYHPQQAQQQQQHFQHPDQQQYHQQFQQQQQQQQYHPHGAGQFQSEESTNQAAISYAEAPSSSSSSAAVQQTGGHSAVTADQDGIASSSNNAAFSLQAPQHLMTAAQSHAVAAYLNSNAGQLQQQQQQQQNGPGFAASYNRPQYAPYPEAASRPYGSNPGTLDVHQVLDQFIRSAGLSPQGDHESVKGDQHYADGSDLKPALSVKKLISYPFYFSSSGDKPTSYGQSIRRHSQDETIFKSALNQNLLASQKMEQPSANAMIESKMEPSSPSTSSYSQQSVSPSDEESQFIAKHAQALQEFLSKPSAQASSAAGNTAHYYSPLGESSSAKDNKVTSSSSSSASSSSANGQTKV